MPRYSHVAPTTFPVRPPCVTVALHMEFDSFAGFASTAPPPPPSAPPPSVLAADAPSDALLQPTARAAAAPITHASAPPANETVLTLAISSPLRADDVGPRVGNNEVDLDRVVSLIPTGAPAGQGGLGRISSTF